LIDSYAISPEIQRIITHVYKTDMEFDGEHNYACLEDLLCTNIGLIDAYFQSGEYEDKYCKDKDENTVFPEYYNIIGEDVSEKIPEDVKLQTSRE